MSLTRSLSVLAVAIAATATLYAQNAPFKLATVVPANSSWHKALLDMSAAVSKDTGGRVNLRVYEGGTQGEELTVVRLMRPGVDQLQASLLMVSGLGAIDEAFNVFGMPFFTETTDEETAVEQKLTPILDANIDALDLNPRNQAGLRPMVQSALYRLLDDVKEKMSKPAPAAPGLIGERPAVEPIEDLGELLGLDPDARVSNLDRRPVVGRRDLHRDRAAGLGELDRVADEVRHDLADPLRVVADPDREVRHGQVKRHVAPARRRPGLFHSGLDGYPQVVGPEVKEDEPGVQLRQLEEVLGQPVEALQLDAADAEELLARLGIVARPLREELVERQ